MISRRALKSRQQAWHVYLQWRWSHSSKNKGRKKGTRVLHIPFFLVSWVSLSSQWKSPTPATDQEHQNQIIKIRRVCFYIYIYNVNLTLHYTEKESTYKRIISLVVADIWQVWGRLIDRRQSIGSNRKYVLNQSAVFPRVYLHLPATKTFFLNCSICQFMLSKI